MLVPQPALHGWTEIFSHLAPMTFSFYVLSHKAEFQHANSSKTYPFGVGKLLLFRALLESAVLLRTLNVLLDELFRQIAPPPSRLVRLGDRYIRGGGGGWRALELEAVAPLRGRSLGRLGLRCQHLVESVEIQRPEIISPLNGEFVRNILNHLTWPCYYRPCRRWPPPSQWCRPHRARRRPQCQS